MFTKPKGIIIISVPALCVSKITVGPSQRIDDRERSVKMLLQTENLEHTEVIKSEIPFNKI